MPPLVARSSSQSKISDSFRSTAKATRPLKDTSTTVKSVAQPVPKTEPLTESDQNVSKQHLVSNDPKLVGAARAIEADRKAPFGTTWRELL